MIKSEPIRDTILYTRISKVNKEFIEKKANEANMDEAPFLDRVLTALRTTEEGQAMMAFDVDIDNAPKRRVK